MRIAKPIAKNALIILINLSSDDEIIRSLAEDDTFLDSLLRKINVSQQFGVINVCLGGAQGTG